MAIALLMAPGNAFASTARAAGTYPDCIEVSIVLNLSAHTLVGGANLTVEGHAKANSGPDPKGKLSVTAFGKTYTAPTNVNIIVIKTPVVSTKKTFTIIANFTPKDLCSKSSAAGAVTSNVTTAGYVISTDNNHVTPASYLKPVAATDHVTLLPAGSSTGALPNTGGTNLWYVVWGGLLLGVGVAIVGTVNARRAKKLL